MDGYRVCKSALNADAPSACYLVFILKPLCLLRK